MIIMIMNKTLRLSLLLLVVCSCGEAKYFETRCDLVQELKLQGFPENKMADWVCLIENESGRKTDALGKVNKNGSRDYGLFQINDKWWCSNTTTPGHTCKVICADLITDDITKASICAKKIYRRQGFLAWHGWEKRCQENLPDVTMC